MNYKFPALSFIICLCVFSLKAQITLITPKDNIVTTNPKINFSWNTTVTSSRYILQISNVPDFSVVITSIQTNSNSASYTLPTPTSNVVYYWRAREGNTSAWSKINKITLISIKNFSSLSAWFTADSNLVHDVANNVSSWNDLSINANNAVQPNITSEPTFIAQEQTIANKPSVRFSSDFSPIKTLDFINPIALNNFTILLVRTYEESNTSAQYVIAGVDNGILSEIKALNSGYGHYRFGQFRFADLASTLPNTQFSIYTHKNDLIRKNGIVTPLAFNNVCPSLLLDRMGTRSDATQFAYKGRLAEVIMYNNSLPSDSVEILEQYLRYKYAAPVNLGFDSIFGNSFCDTLRLYVDSGYKSFLWSTGETTQSIKATTNGNYSVKVKDIFGYESSDDITVLPYSKLNNRTIYICSGDTFKLDLKTPPGFTALWNTGATTTKLNITTAGTYTVKITDNNGCFVNDTIIVLADKLQLLPTPNVSGNLSVCLSEKLFLNTTTGIDSIRWSTGSTEPFISVVSPGNYSVYAITTAGCVLNQSFNITIAGTAPVVNFNYTNVCQNSATVFTDSSSAASGSTITSFKWTFGDGNSTTGSTANNIYTDLGSYTVGYKITTNQGCSDSISKTISVRQKPIPNFDIRLSCSAIPTAFVDQTVANAASITNWVWDFNGLGTINGIQNPAFVFPAAGTYNVKLTATNSNGCSDTVSLPATVNTSPISNFSFDDVCGKTPVSFQFLATVQPPSTITQWLWDFGDATTEDAIKNAQHKYNEPGTYDVTLTTRSSDACVGITTKQVKVFDFPEVDFDVSQTQCTGKEIQFTDISSTPDGTPINNWNWFFSGQSTSTEQNPRYTFNTQGNYTIQLTAKNQVGCSGTKLRSIAVSAPPIPKFTFSPQNGLPPLTVTYTNQSPVSGNYIWNYGDGSPSVSGYNPPVHVYSTIGSYPIKLIATDFRGCTDTLTKLILVDKAFLDGAMASVSIIPNGEYYQIQVSVINNSNVEITALGLGLQLGTGSVIRESWIGSLLPGKTLVYTFTGEIKISENAIPVVCAIIDNVNNNSLEDRIDNNTSCKEVAVGVFDVLNIYPNPTYEIINFGVMLPKDGRVNIQFIDILGQFMYSKDFDGLKGYNNLTMTAIPLNAAVYVAEILYDGQIIHKKFMRKDRK